LPALVAIAAARQDGPHAPELATPAPAVAFRPAKVPDVASYACATCHAEVTAEWAASAHGLAWVDEVYQAALKDKKRPELCHGCHVPELLLGAGLAPRADAREEILGHGVRCEACHQDESGTMLGPRGTSVDAHPSKVVPEMVAPGSTALCSLCHSTNIGPVLGIAKDFAAAKMAERGLSCVGCHMATVERAWATDAPIRPGRSHLLQTPRDPAFLRHAIGLAWRADGGKSRLVLKNQAGHRVPGLIGRELHIRAELCDAEGKTIETVEKRIDERAYLPVDGELELPFTKTGASVHVTGRHKDPRATEPVPFLDERVETSGR